MGMDEFFDQHFKISKVLERNLARRVRVYCFTNRMRYFFPWMKWPIAQYIYSFWESIFDEGIRNTCIPRWGVITFAYLNDGMKPTLWHTWRQITHNNHLDKYCGIYPSGAPKSLAEAQELERRYENAKD